MATDGGLYKKLPNNETYNKIENNTTTQFYRVAYNPREPQSYQGGAQDNNCTKGNVNDLDNWFRFSGGDGFQLHYHPSEEYYFTESQFGNINMFEGTEENNIYLGGLYLPNYTNGLNTNWNVPYVFSKENPFTMFTAGESVFKIDWTNTTFFEDFTIEEISSRLTNEALEDIPRTTRSVTSLDISTINENILYAGTGDARAWRTLDNAENWERIDTNLPERFITSIKASPNNENTVFITHSGYRSNEYIPHIHRSEDNGTTWQDISANLPQAGINDVYIMPNHADSVLFVGTDIGVYATLNAGESWERLGNNMPYVPAMDLEINPVENTLFVGTFAKSILSYPLDSLFFVEEEPIVDCTNIEDKISVSINNQNFCPNDNIILNVAYNDISENATLTLIFEPANFINEYELNGSGVIEQVFFAPEVSCLESYQFTYVVNCIDNSQVSFSDNLAFSVYAPVSFNVVSEDECFYEIAPNCESYSVSWALDENLDGIAEVTGTDNFVAISDNTSGELFFYVNGSGVCGQETLTTSYAINCNVNTSNKILENEFNIYPNILTAENAVLNIESKQNSNANIQLYNVSGNLVFESNINNSYNSKIVLPHLNAGIYFLQIESKKSLYKEKILIF